MPLDWLRPRSRTAPTPRTRRLGLEALEARIVMDANPYAGVALLNASRISLYSQADLGASVTPLDPALAAFAQGTGWAGTSAGSVVTTQSGGNLLSLAGGSGGATPSGAQYRLPGDAKSAAPSASLIAPNLADDAWLARLGTESGGTPAASASTPAGVYGGFGWTGTTPGYSMLAGPAASFAGYSGPPGGTSWGNTSTFANPDGTTTVLTSSGSSGGSSSWSYGGSMTSPTSMMDGTSGSSWATNSVTTDAAGNVVAVHTADYTTSSQYHSVMTVGMVGGTTGGTGTTTGGTTGSTVGSSWSFTLTTTTSAHSYDFTVVTLHRVSGSVADDAKVTTTDSASSSSTLDESGGSTAGLGTAGTSSLSYAYTADASGSHLLHSAGKAVLAQDFSNFGTEVYGLDQNRLDTSHRDESATLANGTPTASSLTTTATHAAGST